MSEQESKIGRCRPIRRQSSQGLLTSLPKGLSSSDISKKMTAFLDKIPTGEVGCTVSYPMTRKRSKG
jgi:hypothetical protein